MPVLRWPRGRCCRFDDALVAERARNLSAPRRRRRRARGSARPSRAVLPSSVRGRESYTSWLAGWLAGPGTASHRVIIRVANGHRGGGGGGGLRSPHGIDRRLAEGVVEIQLALRGEIAASARHRQRSAGASARSAESY
eukprot:COSAG01_NODE_697_length_14188_cov_41.810348_12_plen_139_part_00